MTDAETSLRNLLASIAKDKSYEPYTLDVKATNSGGANYTSALFFATISSPSKDDLNLFAKVAIIGEKMRTHMSADWLYSTERYVYTKLAKIYEDLQEKYEVPLSERFVFPNFHGYSSNLGEETIVMENLVANGYSDYNRKKTVNWEHASTCIDFLAKFHALSFAFQKEMPEEFEEATKNLVFNMGSDDEETQQAWMKIMVNSLQVVREEYKQKIFKILENTTQKEFMEFNQPRGRPVLTHGDFRPSNLMYKRRDGKLRIIPLDYQTVHAGCPATDLVYFIILATDEKFRRVHYQQLVDLYYDRLSKAMKRLHVDPEEMYSRKEFDEDLEAMLPYSLILGVMVLPIVTVETEDAPKIDGDADLNNFVLKPNEMFAERFSGIVNDCVRWGIL